MANTTTYLRDYQPPNFTVITVNLDFELYDDHTLVRNQMVLRRQASGELTLYGDGLELVGVYDDKMLLPSSAYRLEGDDLVILASSDEVTLTIVTRLRPQDNTTLSGLYRSNHMMCTQCEALGFRRITFFPDRPDVLATYTTRISADKAQFPVLLSNGNLIESGDMADGRHWAIWHDPFKKPSYLFALVAGNLECVTDEFITRSGRRIDLRLYVEPGETDKCAHALFSLKQAMAWDEAQFGREYDLDIYMIVAVSDFNMGAMENKGLNLFNSKYILARPDTATDTDYAGILGVVAHEYFHNWTGNRITCRDWFQLSLKEGLTVFRDQEFSRDMNGREVNRILDVKALRNTQFPEDAGKMAHPVRPDSYQEISNFYTATIYNKGAEVIRMQQTLLGQAGFLRGMDLYFERHDGCAVTIDDFVAAMEDANQIDLTQFKRWYSQAGTPTLTVKSEYAHEQLSLHITQTCPITKETHEKQPFHIPISIALFSSKGEKLPVVQEVLELRESSQTFHFTGLKEKPLVSLLRDFSAPVIVVSDTTEDELLDLLRFETNGFAKWDAAQNLAMTSLLAFYHTPQNTWKIKDALLRAYESVLIDDTLDPALRAELLIPPTYEELASRLTGVDVTKACDARDFFIKEISRGLYSKAIALYDALILLEVGAMSGQAFGLRKLRNVCLWLMMEANEVRALPVALKQYANAKTMSCQLASLSLIVNSTDVSARRNALGSFYEQWKKEELVLDKWFTVQATSNSKVTLTGVKTLLSHPSFNLKNPNKVRALISAFCQMNPRYFHATDGSGYRFLTSILIELDQINPQISARLATPYTRWPSLDLNRQQLIKEELSQLAKHVLSADLSELVTKSLSNAV